MRRRATTPLASVALGDVFRDAGGHLYEAVGLIDRPAVILRAVDMGDIEGAFERTLVIGSPQFKEYAHLTEADA